MTDLPEDDLRESTIPLADDASSAGNAPASPAAEFQPDEATAQEPPTVAPSPAAPEPIGHSYTDSYPGQPAPSVSEPQLFQSFVQPPIRRPARIPHFGHLCLLALMVGVAYVCMGALFLLAAHFHLFGWQISTLTSVTNIHVILASEALLYLITFAISFAVFPLLWKESFFAGVQWRSTVALDRFWPLAATALGCAALATVDELVMPGPSNAPIEEMMRSPGAAWLMFGFGVTIAPFFEEMFFRGFLLPSLCTAWDWAIERSTGKPAPPLGSNGQPQWSLFAMIIASILTSIPFALLHVAQQGHSLGPFLLLIVVSLVLCTVRLRTRSLAASTLVHACYNFIIFSLAFIGSGGFRHFEKT
ncbi:MAG: type II CAAX endopeptidase family protein [Terracidiphilus sp.]|jgi:hypothetical protein